jgi:hypothetical protein
MFRKLILAGAAAAALCFPALGTSKAQAGSFDFDVRFGRRDFGIRVGHGQRHVHNHHFHLMYRDCWHSPWRCYGIYDCEREAYRVADFLRYRGYSTRIVCH